MASTSHGIRDLEVPLRPMGSGLESGEESLTTADLCSYIAVEPDRQSKQCILRWMQCINMSTMAAVLVSVVLTCYLCAHLLVVNFQVIWNNGFVAALFLGGLAFVIKAVAQWMAINIFARFFMTTIKLSKDTKEATPVLEWFKVWLPKMMKDNGAAFRSVQPLFRKKDGSTFFTFLRDTRNCDKFELITWVTPGTHFFRYHSNKLGGSIDILMHYWTGETKKEGWDQSLTVMENIILTVFDPFSLAMPFLMDMLSEAQHRFAERDLDCIRFQEWHGWKQMWESESPDERIAPTFKTLAFYPKELLTSVEAEVEHFLKTPSEILLRAGLPLKLGFLFHGPPGTGKTNLVRYLAAKYRLPINIVDCNSGHMDNLQLLHAVVNADGIILFEDIDNLDAACGRVRESGLSLLGNKAHMNKCVTLDGLLNALDGVHRGTQKRIMIATTNFAEKLIPSIRRRGRFGISHHIDYPQDAELLDMLAYYLPHLPALDILKGIKTIELRTGLRLTTAGAIDIIAKLGLSAGTSGQGKDETVATLLHQVEASLFELLQSNRKRLYGTHELLTLLGMQKYAPDFLRNGLVDLRYVKLLNDAELEKVGVTILGDRKKLLDAFQYMEDTPPLQDDQLAKATLGLKALLKDTSHIFLGVEALLKSVIEDEELRAVVETKFKEQGLSESGVKELKKLDAGDLEKLGVERLGDRKTLLLRIEKLEEGSDV